jgi:hypothetical protein
MSGACSLLLPLLLKALPAKNWPPLRWFEGDGGFFAAL